MLRPFDAPRWWVLALPLGQLFGTSGPLREEFARIGGQTAIVNAYLAALLLLAGLIASAYGVSAVLRVSGPGADLVLADAVGRVRWALGLAPDACAAVGWTALGLVVALSIFGPALRLSHWVLDLSPFTQTPRLPGGAVAAAPLAWLPALAVASAALGLAALRRRDIAGS